MNKNSWFDFPHEFIVFQCVRTSVWQRCLPNVRTCTYLKVAVCLYGVMSSTAKRNGQEDGGLDKNISLSSTRLNESTFLTAKSHTTSHASSLPSTISTSQILGCTSATSTGGHPAARVMSYRSMWLQAALNNSVSIRDLFCILYFRSSCLSPGILSE